MRNFLPLLALPVLATALTACGDLSQEDLLFRAAVPQKQQVELRTAGAGSQASTSSSTASTVSQGLAASCADGDLRCNAEKTAHDFNALTFGLLDVIDTILKQEPTTRSHGRRVWGPFFIAGNGDKPDGTARFEMFREDDGVTFGFCLHAAEGRIENRQAADVNCDVDVDADTHLAVILSGTFTPGEIGARARTGSGDLHLRTDRIRDFHNIARTMNITFDNTHDETDIELSLDGVVFNGNELIDPLSFHFVRKADASGSLHFDVLGDIFNPNAVVPPATSPTPSLLEKLNLDAEWDAAQAGRAHATIDGGDLPVGGGFVETQCWDAAGSTVFVTATPPNGHPHHGSEGLCVFRSDPPPPSP